MAIPQTKAGQQGNAGDIDAPIVFTIDEATANSTVFIPEDDYMVKITKVTRAPSKAGKDQIVLECTIQGEPGDVGKGLHLWDYIPLDKESKGYPKMLYQRAKAAGIEVKPGQSANTIRPSQFLDLYMGVTVVNQEYPVGSGQMKPKIAKVFNLNDPAPAAQGSGQAGDPNSL